MTNDEKSPRGKPETGDSRIMTKGPPNLRGKKKPRKWGENAKKERQGGQVGAPTEGGRI